jgi:hypothetical protein
MRMTKRRRALSIGMGLVILLLSSCQQVSINDETVYALKGPGRGAFYAHTLTTEQGSLSQAEWDVISAGMLCMSANSFGDLKAIIEQLCSYNPNECNYPQVQPVVTRLTTLIKKAKKK